MEDFRSNQPDYEIAVNAIHALHFWATQNCTGYHVDGLNQRTYEDCQIYDCSKKHNFDFCYTCVEYPEKINKVDKWREANDYMFKHGETTYFKKEKNFLIIEIIKSRTT